jgi:hypothetical protein
MAKGQAMKRRGFCILLAFVIFSEYGFTATNDFRITAIGLESNNVRITWQCTGPSNFMLQASANVTGSWNTVFISSPTMITTNMAEVGGATNTPARFYRVRIIVPS